MSSTNELHQVTVLLPVFYNRRMKDWKIMKTWGNAGKLLYSKKCLKKKKENAPLFQKNKD